jgi:hypothetical protein
MSLLTINEMLDPNPPLGTVNIATHVVLIRNQAGQGVKGLSKSDFWFKTLSSPIYPGTSNQVGLDLYNVIPGGWAGWYKLVLRPHWYQWRAGYYSYVLDVDKLTVTGSPPHLEAQTGHEVLSFALPA